MSSPTNDNRDPASRGALSHEDREREHDRKIVEKRHNTARYFTETPHVAWVALVFTFVWGIYGYVTMPKAKDPFIEVRVAVAACSWPGAAAEKVEQLVTRKIEQKLAESSNIEKIESISRTGVSFVYVTLKENVNDRAKEWNDIEGRLATIRDLPDGASPVQFQKDFGDTATLMLTVASPRATDVDLALRAGAVTTEIEKIRKEARQPGPRATLVACFPPDVDTPLMIRTAELAARYFDGAPGTHDARAIHHPSFLGVDFATTLSDEELRDRAVEFVREHLRLSELHPDVWRIAIVRAPAEAEAKLVEVAGERYSYRDLDRFTDTIQRHLQSVPIVSKVTRTGVLPEQIYLEYSQAKLASYGIDPSKLAQVIAARNITASGGTLEVAGRNVSIDPSGELTSDKEIGGIVIATSPSGAPVYLRDLVEIRRDYQSPPRFLNYLATRAPDGKFERTRAVTLAINMRPGAQIGDFAKDVDKELDVVKKILPEDLVIRRTSDQPLQVRENVSLFMSSLYEAIGLVVLVALIGFWEWRTALLLALCIPITLAMTFGMMRVAGIDIQQISIASLIIALGLLVDDPVVASDAIKHALAHGWKPKTAAWLGPTKLEVAILFATVTNIASYLPFLALPGDVGKFIRTLPIVLSFSLVASRIVSMTFVPLLGAALLRPPKKPEPTAEERRSRGFGRFYYRVVGWAIDHRRPVLLASVAVLLVSGLAARALKPAFFPKDLSYLSYVDIWLPEDAPLSATREKSEEAGAIIRQACDDWGKSHPEHGKPRRVLESITEFVGGGGPRFWFSVSPEQQQLNYAQLVIQVKDKEDTRHLVPFLQERLSQKIAGARIDVRQLETGKPVGVPVAVRISGEDEGLLRSYSEKAQAIFRATPGTERVRDDWGSSTFAVKLDIQPDRANLTGITNLDVARSAASAMSGLTVGRLRDGDRQIPIVARLRADERTELGSVGELYVIGQQNAEKVPLGQVARVTYTTQTEKIRRRNQFRTITVACFPSAGLLSSEVMKVAKPSLMKLAAEMPPGYSLEIAGEAEEQTKSFGELVVVLVMLIVAIYVALVIQFKNAVKPLIVFAALPYGAAAALVSLVITGAPFSFMAFLGLISLMGVIVSHVIVLFDFIEEMHQRGEDMREALLDAGLMRLRPVLITVVATVLGLVPLAVHGGPLWEPLCFAQIGGLTFATVVTLLIVPVLYTFVVKDLRWVRWSLPATATRPRKEGEADDVETPPPSLLAEPAPSRP